MGQRFAFSDDQYRQLLAVIGRDDAPAQAYLADLESIARAFPLLMEPTDTGGLPQSVVTHLAAVSRAARDLQRCLYALPADARDLLALHLISEATGQALWSDLKALEEPLGDLVRISHGLIESGADGSTSPDLAPAERLLRVAARAFRNHFNVNVLSEPSPAFEHSMALVLEALAEQGHRPARGMKDRLPSMCRALGAGPRHVEPQ